VEKTVPVRFRRAVQEGILEWNKAYEKVGIAGAIEVRQQTDTQFSELDPEDVNYNFFRWITSDGAFAMGPSRVDPRTGQIMDADIIFDDSMIQWYLLDHQLLVGEVARDAFSPAMHRYLDDPPARDPARRTWLGVREKEGARPNREALEALNRVPDDGRKLCSLGNGLVDQMALAHLAHLAGLIELGEAEKADWPEDFLYQVVKDHLPEPALYMIRYHSFYAAHREGAYGHLMNDRDREMFRWVRAFNPYDLYSKGEAPPKVDALRPYYEDLIAEYFPATLRW
jgi:hypothetical protein